MLVWLAEHLVKYYSGFNVFSYLTFRAIVSLLTALFISLWMGPRMIARLQKLAFGQVVRNDGPESHFSKRGTPTMGGIMILTAITVSVLLWAYPSNPYVWCVLTVLIGYGIIGFVDDYRKVVRKDTKGLIARWKYFWMSVIALGVAFALYLAGKDTPATELVVPFFKDVMPQLGLFYILLAYFVIVGTGNAVNLTDGLDGLCTGVTFVSMIGYLLAGSLLGFVHVSLIAAATKIAEEESIKLQYGVYVGGTGPTFETQAEYRYFKAIGGDAAGMSTVPEVIVARHMSIPVFGVSVITNCGLSDEVGDHEDVQRQGKKAGVRMELLFRRMIKNL